jgi:hypothetical protein
MGYIMQELKQYVAAVALGVVLGLAMLHSLDALFY